MQLATDCTTNKPRRAMHLATDCTTSKPRRALKPSPTFRRLTLPEAMLCAQYATRESDRLQVRRSILLALRDMLPGAPCAAEAARIIYVQMRDGGPAGYYSDCLKAVRDLSRGRATVSVDSLQRIFAE